MYKRASVDLVEDRHWNAIINSYKIDYVKVITDAKHGSGAADYIIKAFQYYTDHEQ